MSKYQDKWEEGSTNSTYGVVCPYCQHAHADTCDYFKDGRECEEFECESCEKTFMAIVSVKYTYYGCKQIQEDR